jgi:hypothetical protein
MSGSPQWSLSLRLPHQQIQCDTTLLYKTYINPILAFVYTDFYYLFLNIYVAVLQKFKEERNILFITKIRKVTSCVEAE